MSRRQGIYGPQGCACGAGYHAAPAAEDTAWMLQGACVSQPTELFYADTEKATVAAVAICRGCPVLAQCRSWALAHREQHGVWGGLTREDRLALWKGRPLPTRRPRRRRVA